MQDQEAAIARQLTREDRCSQFQPDQLVASAEPHGAAAVELASSGAPSVAVLVQEALGGVPEGGEVGG